MAQETASITIQLEDEFSAKMAEVTAQLEEFKKKLGETSKQTCNTESIVRRSRHVSQERLARRQRA